MPLPILFNGVTKPGEISQYVMLLQRFLVMNNMLGVGVPTVPDPVDGSFDSATEQGVKEFQKFSRIPENGVVEEMTWAAIAGVSQGLKSVNANDLGSKLPTLRFDDKNTLVTVLQRLLVEYSGNQPGWHFIPSRIITQADVENGKDTFDDKTRDAVMKFQTNRAIGIDGEVGSETWKKLVFPKIDPPQWKP